MKKIYNGGPGAEGLNLCLCLILLSFLHFFDNLNTELLMQFSALNKSQKAVTLK